MGANHDSSGIVNGLHRRLDVSCNEDRCRVRTDDVLSLFETYRRLADSLFAQWRQHQHRPDHVTTSGLQSRMSEEHKAKASRLVLNQRPALKTCS